MAMSLGLAWQRTPRRALAERQRRRGETIGATRPHVKPAAGERARPSGPRLTPCVRSNSAHHNEKKRYAEQGLHFMTEQENCAALQGLRVVECATVIAAPLCGRMLADFGAEVIHVEPPGKGDHLRTFGFTVDGINPWWKYYARNKKLITLDISQPKGRDILFELLKDADVFIENFRPGRLEGWGICFEDLHKVNPRLIMVRVTGYGQTGPYASQPGFGTLMEAMSGFAEMTGEPDGPPTLPQFALADSCAGFYAAMATMFAVYHRDVVGSGKGQVIDVSIWESLFSILGPNALVEKLTGAAPRRIGNRAPTSAPRNTYKTSDGRFVALAGSTQTTARRLFSVIGSPELIDDPRFANNMDRVKNVDALDAYIREWMSRHTLDEVSAILRQADVPFGPVNSIVDIAADPHAQARRMIVGAADEGGATLPMEGVFPRMVGTPGSIRHAGKSIGADNDEIFRERLGYSQETLDALVKEGIV
jgi:crotonobetainyl-CoA:carnitine CoA-transferase CaiB-like acyl-CoA transferase